MNDWGGLSPCSGRQPAINAGKARGAGLAETRGFLIDRVSPHGRHCMPRSVDLARRVHFSLLRHRIVVRQIRGFLTFTPAAPKPPFLFASAAHPQPLHRLGTIPQKCHTLGPETALFPPSHHTNTAALATALRMK